jgi:hypothetical protein
VIVTGHRASRQLRHPMLGLVLPPGLLAAGTGSLIFIGLET